MTPFGYIMEECRKINVPCIDIQNYTLAINIIQSRVHFNDRFLVIKTKTMYKLIKLYRIGVEDVY